MIEIYGKPQCPFCDRAKALCEQKGYEYTYKQLGVDFDRDFICLLYTSPSPRDATLSRMPSSA